MNGWGFLADAATRGALRGIEFAERQEDRALQRQLQQRQMERDDQRWAWEQEDRDLKRTLQRYQMEDLLDERRRREVQNHANYLLVVQEQAVKDPDGFRKHLAQNPAELRRINESYNAIFRNMIQRGGPPGSTKRFAGMVPTDDRRLIPVIEVTTADGRIYRDAMTLNRSDDPDDPPVAFTPEEVVSTLVQVKHLADLVDAHLARAGDTSAIERRRAAAAERLAHQRDLEKLQVRGNNDLAKAHITGQYGLKKALLQAGSRSGGGDATGPQGQKLSPYSVQTGDAQIEEIVAKELGGRFDSVTGQWNIPEGNSERFSFGARIAQELHRRHFRELPEAAPATYASIGLEAARKVPTREEAREKARQEAERKAGLFRSDRQDFGGSREDWIEARANEIIAAAQEKAVREAHEKARLLLDARESGQRAPESNSQLEITPDIKEAARRDPHVYRRVLRAANPDASDADIEAAVARRFPNVNR